MRGVVCVKIFSVSIGILLVLNATALTAPKKFEGAFSDTSIRSQKVESLAQKAAVQKLMPTKSHAKKAGSSRAK